MRLIFQLGAVQAKGLNINFSFIWIGTLYYILDVRAWMRKDMLWLNDEIIIIVVVIIIYYYYYYYYY